MTAADACPDEAELLQLARGTASAQRGVALREHIGDCEACRMVVADLASVPSDAPPPIPAGEGGARYELARLVGAGGMGEVFVARDTVLGRDVAIKFLREDTSSAETLARSRRRVLREARALASFAHPNVVAVYDQGVLDGRAFLAMEFVRGRTLRQWIGDEKPDRARLLDALVQAGKGLFAAHEVGLVHRDFKPDNVLVGEDGRVRVTDFGLACAAPEAAPAPDGVALGPALQSSSLDGSIAGTPAYMAPEQLEGHAADARSDQYAFCVSVYEAIHGRRPSSDPDPDADAANRGVSRAGASGKRGKMPREALDEVLARGLSETPSQRYPSMRELLADLAAASSTDRPRLPSRGRIAAFAFTAVAFVALAIVWFHHRASAGRPSSGGGGGAAYAGLHQPCAGVGGVCEAPLRCSYRAGNYCGASGERGICAFPSDGCTAKSPVVCGCDGVTYKNSCEATTAGVSSAYHGSCVPCEAGAACPDVNAGGVRSPAFCHLEMGSSATGEAGARVGVCWPRPSSCAAGGPAVCGWDGMTYENACEARRAGTEAAREGRCGPEAPREVAAGPGDAAPAGGGLSFGEPDEQGMDARPLMSLAKWVRADHLPIFSILVSRNGVVVFELYGPGVAREQAEYIWGLTAPFTTALVGAAIDRHLLRSPEMSIADALPAELFPSAADRERFRAVSVADVLSMSALHAPLPVLDQSEEAKERQQRFNESPDRLRFALQQPLVTEPGVTHESTDVNGMISAGVLAAATGKSLVHFAKDVLFEPLGFEGYEWLYEDPVGLENGTYGLRLRPVDLQKLGILYLQQGVFGGRRVVSSDWTLRTWTPRLKSSPSQPKANIGWGWWDIDYGDVAAAADVGRAGWAGHLAGGLRGQRLVVFPARRVVVTLIGLIAPEDEVATIRRIVRGFVIPSVDGTGAAPAAPDPALRAPLHELLDQVRSGPLPSEVAAVLAQHPQATPSVGPRVRAHRPLHLLR